MERCDGTNRWDVRLIADSEETVISVHNLKEDAVYGASRCRDCAKTFQPNFFDRPLLGWLEKFLIRLNRNFDYADDSEMIFLDKSAMGVSCPAIQSSMAGLVANAKTIVNQ
jgi:hypothetical protein